MTRIWCWAWLGFSLSHFKIWMIFNQTLFSCFHHFASYHHQPCHKHRHQFERRRGMRRNIKMAHSVDLKTLQGDSHQNNGSMLFEIFIQLVLMIRPNVAFVLVVWLSDLKHHSGRQVLLSDVLTILIKDGVIGGLRAWNITQWSLSDWKCDTFWQILAFQLHYKTEIQRK